MEGQAKMIQEFNNKMESLQDEIGIQHDELQEQKSRCKNLEEEKKRRKKRTHGDGVRGETK